MGDKFFIEVNCQQKNHEGERICGDVFLSASVKEENRIIAVLSDGMGHGVKANILATLTSTMALNFTKEHKEFEKIAEIIMNTLPVCSDRGVSYSTFTIVDIDYNGETSILEYDNPQCIIMRGKKVFEPDWEYIELNSDKNRGKELRTCKFIPRKEDRIIFFTDGITQSGLGFKKYTTGWGRENVQEYALTLVANTPGMSARKLAARIVNTAYKNDAYLNKDDLSCAVLYFREPRKLLVCTGPPFNDEKDVEMAEIVDKFKGKKIISGATTSEIVSKALNRKITDSNEFADPDLPPVSYMEGVDLITEGILTLSKVNEIVKNYYPSYNLGKGPADRFFKLLRASDEIHFLVGTRINIAHHDPNVPVELEARRTVVNRIARLLEEKFMKQVRIRYI
jgi:hypothetical protein